MHQVLIKKEMFPKVLEKINQSLLIPKISKNEVFCYILSSINKELSLDLQSDLSSSMNLLHYKPPKITDVRLMSSQTPVSLKLDILSKTSLFISQQPLVMIESAKALKDPSPILNSPTILQICSNKGLFLTSHNCNSICIWKFKNTLSPFKKIELSSVASEKVINIQQTSHNTALITLNSSFHLIDLQRLEIIKNYVHNKGLVQVIKTISNEKVVIGTFVGTLNIFNHNTFEFESSQNLFNADGNGPFRALGCCDKIVVAGGRDGILKIWDIVEGILYSLGAHAGEITAITVSNNHHFMISAGDDKYIILWAMSIDTFTMVWRKKHPSLTLSLQISSDTLLMLISTNKGFFLSNLSKFSPIQIKPTQHYLLYNTFYSNFQSSSNFSSITS